MHLDKEKCHRCQLKELPSTRAVRRTVRKLLLLQDFEAQFEAFVDHVILERYHEPLANATLSKPYLGNSKPS